MVPLGAACPNFRLVDVVTGNSVSQADFFGRPLLVMFICNHCPFVTHVQEELARLGRDATALGVGVVGVCSNDVRTHPMDGPEEMKVMARRQSWTFPYLHDESQAVARAFDAACTPDFFLYSRDHTLAYRGQLDDSRPGNSHPVTGADLRAALACVVEGRAMPTTQRPSMGCNIKWKP
jgi:peroxiredoxin